MNLAAVLSDTPLRLVHIFLLVAWLGIDVGVFYTSIVLRRAGLSGETRLVLTRLLTFIDLAPRLSLIFMVPVGLGLAYASGLGLDELGSGAMNALFWGTVAVAFVWSSSTVWSMRAQRARPFNGATVSWTSRYVSF